MAGGHDGSVDTLLDTLLAVGGCAVHTALDWVVFMLPYAGSNLPFFANAQTRTTLKAGLIFLWFHF